LVGRTQSQPADTPGRTLLNPEARKCTRPDRTVLILSPGGNETVLGGRQFFSDPALASPRYHGWLQLQRCFQVMRRAEARILGAACEEEARGFPRFRDAYLWTGCSRTREWGNSVYAAPDEYFVDRMTCDSFPAHLNYTTSSHQ
jgi:hypothetical protein